LEESSTENQATIEYVNFSTASVVGDRNLVNFDRLFNTLDNYGAAITTLTSNQHQIGDVLTTMAKNINSLITITNGLVRSQNEIWERMKEEKEKTKVSLSNVGDSALWFATGGKEGKPPNKALRAKMFQMGEKMLGAIPEVGPALALMTEIAGQAAEYTIDTLDTDYNQVMPFRSLAFANSLKLSIGQILLISAGLNEGEKDMLQGYTFNKLSDIELVRDLLKWKVPHDVNLLTHVVHMNAFIFGIPLFPLAPLTAGLKEGKVYVPSHSYVYFEGVERSSYDFGSGEIDCARQWMKVFSVGEGITKDPFAKFLLWIQGSSLSASLSYYRYWDASAKTWVYDSDADAKAWAKWKNHGEIVQDDYIPQDRDMVEVTLEEFFVDAPRYDLKGSFNCHISVIALMRWFFFSELPPWIHYDFLSKIAEKLALRHPNPS
jgi:hypothetical protein